MAPCEKRFTTESQLRKLLKGDDSSMRNYAEKCLNLLKAGQKIPDQVEYRVQTLWLNKGFALIGLDVEPLCALGRVVEQAAAPAKGILLGYVSGSVSYAPGAEEAKRGGYEVDGWKGRPWTGPLALGLEHRFAKAVAKLSECRRD
jgi:hypothetical protein